MASEAENIDAMEKQVDQEIPFCIEHMVLPEDLLEDLPPDGSDEAEAIRIALEQDAEDIPLSFADAANSASAALAPTTTPAANSLAVRKGTKWPSGTTILIKFLNGEPEWHEAVIEHACEWLKAPVNLNFLFTYPGDTDPADVRIYFHPTHASCSVPGN